MPTLQRKFRQLARADDYGNPVLNKWDREVDYFIKTVVVPQAKQRGKLSDEEYSNGAVREIMQFWIDSELDENPQDRFMSAPLTPVTGVDYERHCQFILEENGWEVRQTPLSGDQGADLVAEKGGRRVVIQCKFYNSPVGNKAVQEVYSAKAHVAADVAAVVSNNLYTKGAYELAPSTGVVLLHHDDLAKLDTLTR